MIRGARAERRAHIVRRIDDAARRIAPVLGVAVIGLLIFGSTLR